MTPYDAMLNNEVEAMQAPNTPTILPIGTPVTLLLFGAGVIDSEPIELTDGTYYHVALVDGNGVMCYGKDLRTT